MSTATLDNDAELRAARSEIVRLSTDLAELRADLSERTLRMLSAERRAEALTTAVQEAQAELRLLSATVYDPQRRERARRHAHAVRRRREELSAWEARAETGDAHALEHVEHVRTIYVGTLAMFFEAAEETLALPPATGGDDAPG